VHTVLEGQSLAQIAEAYFTDQSAIEKENAGQSDPLVVGIKLRIPYSDESLEAMSKRAKYVTPKVNPVYVKEGDSTQKRTTPIPYSKPVPTEKKKEQPTPIEEVIDLMKEPEQVAVVEKKSEPLMKEEEPEALPSLPEPEPEPEPEVVSVTKPEEKTDSLAGDSEKALADLEELSRNINQSLENLAKIKESLEPAKIDPKTGELLEVKPEPELEELPGTTLNMSQILNQQATNFFDTATNNHFLLKEFFIAEVNGHGQITRLKDERTVTNQNSNYLNIADLRGVRIESLSSGMQKLSLGLITDIQQYKYKVKVKKNKVRLYQTQGFVEHFPKDHQHAQLILDAANNAGVKGKGSVVIMEGYKEVASYKPFEYNPFGTKDKTIMKEGISRIEQLDF